MTTDVLVLPDYLDLAAAAAVLGIHTQTLRRLVKQGIAPGRLVFGKYLIERAALQQFAACYDRRSGPYVQKVKRLL